MCRAWETAGHMATGGADPWKLAAPWGVGSNALNEKVSREREIQKLWQVSVQ